MPLPFHHLCLDSSASVVGCSKQVQITAQPPLHKWAGKESVRGKSASEFSSSVMLSSGVKTRDLGLSEVSKSRSLNAKWGAVFRTVGLIHIWSHIKLIIKQLWNRLRSCTIHPPTNIHGKIYIHHLYIKSFYLLFSSCLEIFLLECIIFSTSHRDQQLHKFPWIVFKNVWPLTECY